MIPFCCKNLMSQTLLGEEYGEREGFQTMRVIFCCEYERTRFMQIGSYVYKS